MVVVSPDDNERRKMIHRLAVRLGFAITQGDAAKVVRKSPYDYDLATTYFVLAETFNFNASPVLTQRLYEMAARGIAVVVGVKRLQQQYEFIAEVYTEENL